MEDKGIHYPNVHEMIEEGLVPLGGLVHDLVGPDQGVGEGHSHNAPGRTEIHNIEKKIPKH